MFGAKGGMTHLAPPPIDWEDMSDEEAARIFSGDRVLSPQPRRVLRHTSKGYDELDVAVAVGIGSMLF